MMKTLKDIRKEETKFAMYNELSVLTSAFDSVEKIIKDRINELEKKRNELDRQCFNCKVQLENIDCNECEESLQEKIKSFLLEINKCDERIIELKRIRG